MSFFDSLSDLFDVDIFGPQFWIDSYTITSIQDLFSIRTALPGLAIAAIGWGVATWMERRHLAKMSAREKDLSHITLTTAKRVAESENGDAMLLIGSTVIAHDYFRTFFIAIRKIIGGNIKPYERLLARGRRAALIHLKEEAHLRNIDKIINIRFGASGVSGRTVKGVEIIAYGTGIQRGK